MAKLKALKLELEKNIINAERVQHNEYKRKLDQVKAMCRENARPFEYAFLLDALKNEQAQGIDQVNQAMTQMDSVTQRNAANAEESAAAAEEMSTATASRVSTGRHGCSFMGTS